MSTISKEPVFSVKTEADVVKARFVKLGTGAESGIHATAGTDIILGVTLESATSGSPVALQHEGCAEVEASAAIAIGDKVTATTAGKAITTVTAANTVRGIALTAATTAGQYIKVFLTNFKI
ncbi:MAG: DUF2190 family protein [Candidatus Peregrinibacteria bacterium]